jgi:hypothetical protein
LSEVRKGAEVVSFLPRQWIVQLVVGPATAQVCNEGYRIDQAAFLHQQRALLIGQLDLLGGGDGGVVDRTGLEFGKGDLRSAAGIPDGNLKRVCLLGEDAQPG